MRGFRRFGDGSGSESLDHGKTCFRFRFRLTTIGSRAGVTSHVGTDGLLKWLRSFTTGVGFDLGFVGRCLVSSRATDRVLEGCRFGIGSFVGTPFSFFIFGFQVWLIVNSSGS